MSFAAAMLIALGLDVLVGWPGWLYARIGHPVTWIGALIAGLERRLNTQGRPRRAYGVVTALAVIVVAAGAGWALAALLPGGVWGTVLTGVLAWPLVAARAMHDHVADIAEPLEQDDLPGARIAVARIVGRDPAQLDAPAISRAALESLAENTSDGIVAPLFWGALLGLPGIAAYKAINTLDSMIGHRNARYGAFGWAAARIDDVANLIPARVTGLMFALASGRPHQGLTVMLRDARKHRSPNAGWPESAMAAALDCRLSGPRQYGTELSDEPWLNAGKPDPGAADIRHGLRLFRRLVVLGAGLLALWAAI